MIATLPSFSAKAAPLWPKYLSRQPGHPICWPACRRAGCLQRAYPSHVTEQDDATTEITWPGTESSNPASSSGESAANLTFSIRAPIEPVGIDPPPKLLPSEPLAKVATAGGAPFPAV